jgi:ubiquinol-cytochrome c reductase cytochrome b subunit
LLLLIYIVLLGYDGGAEINAFNVALGQIASAYYFSHFLIILPFVSRYEKTLPLPNSITESVLHGEMQESAPVGSRPANAASE